ncbi:MAG TPA: hypothetical protein VEK34_14430, partial [Methylocella sp.]|nr:hypothetical protein [Methylocella sp.]
AELDVILAGGIEKPMVPVGWEPRGPARICRSWCEPSGADCIDVCEPAEICANSRAVAQAYWMTSRRAGGRLPIAQIVE